MNGSNCHPFRKEESIQFNCCSACLFGTNSIGKCDRKVSRSSPVLQHEDMIATSWTFCCRYEEYKVKICNECFHGCERTRLDIDTTGRLDIDTTGRLDIDTTGRLDIDTIGRLDIDTIGRLDIDTIGRLDIDTIGRLDIDTIGTLGGVTCTCPPGHRLSTDNRSCTEEKNVRFSNFEWEENFSSATSALYLNLRLIFISILVSFLPASLIFALKFKIDLYFNLNFFQFF